MGLLVGRNRDRGDAKNLPAERFDLCEIEPLVEHPAGSNKWRPDELAYKVFSCSLKDLTVIPIKSFDRYVYQALPVRAAC